MFASEEDGELFYPPFSFSSYYEVLNEIRKRRRIIRLCDFAARVPDERILVLRHDIDFSPSMALEMGTMENALGITATYFVALHLPYNPHYQPHARALHELVRMGHEIGLHYDAAVYDGYTMEETLSLLDKHVKDLVEICGAQIKSIAMHNPSCANGGDPFASHDRYVNAYAPWLMRQTVYLSDSCRAWRQGGLQACFDHNCQRVYLLIHPELWCHTVMSNRLAFLTSLRAELSQEDKAYFDCVERIWRDHAGGKEHDARQVLMPPS
jgi:hypothetical protein